MRSVIPVRRLDRTVDYVQNKAKTTPKSLEEAVDYAANRDKTESACFETGLGCTTTSAFEDMRLNTLRWHKETGVQGYHLVQSFAEGEVTPELAHQIGVEFAEQLLLGKYQAIVTTHLNTKHYHNHIVWSAVSLEDGKKYHSNSKSYYTEVRALSDALCQKYGLSIIETPESLRGKRQYEKWRAEENNQPTWRTAIRQDVDDTYNRQAYAAPSYCTAYMVAHRYGLDTAAFNFDRVVALYGNLGKEQQRGFLSDVNTVGGGLLRSLSRTLAVQTRELPAAEYAVAVPPAKKPSRQQERG